MLSLLFVLSGCDGYNTQMLYFTSSSLGMDDEWIYLISDRDGYLKSYVYFDGGVQNGLGKASVSLDAARKVIYYIQDCDICRVGEGVLCSGINRVRKIKTACGK